MKKYTTDSQEEMLIEVDSKNNIIGPIERGIAHNSKDKIYRCIFVLVFNNDNDLLIQKRSETKDLFPGCWDLSVGGHVLYGQSYIESAVRELEEELGIKAKEEDLTFKGEVLVELPKSREYFHVFEYNLKIDEKINLSKEEVDSFRWMDVNKVLESMDRESEKWYGRPIQVLRKSYGA